MIGNLYLVLGDIYMAFFFLIVSKVWKIVQAQYVPDGTIQNREWRFPLSAAFAMGGASVDHKLPSNFFLVHVPVYAQIGPYHGPISWSLIVCNITHFIIFFLSLISQLCKTAKKHSDSFLLTLNFEKKKANVQKIQRTSSSLFSFLLWCRWTARIFFMYPS